MNAAARESYLVTEAMTATPQKLHLMLIDAAIRFANLARQQWQQGNNEQAGESLIRSQEILTEMICGLNPAGNEEIVRKIRGVYLFVFRALTAAHWEHNDAKVADALRILELERETWRQICEKVLAAPASDTVHADNRVPPDATQFAAVVETSMPLEGGFSLEA